VPSGIQAESRGLRVPEIALALLVAAFSGLLAVLAVGLGFSAVGW
jgi:hypothetical protein